VAFDGTRDNSPQQSIVVQSLPSSPTSEIVSPSGQLTAPFVYPMPTWDERNYNWSLVGRPDAQIAVAISAICSFILLVMAITVMVHKAETDVRMLHYGHVVSMCVAGIAVCWALALLWQSDVNQSQCNACQWLLYVPASYLIHLNNIKAYRLSVFLRSNGRRPKPFTHWHVMQMSLGLTLITVVLLAIASKGTPRRMAQLSICKSANLAIWQSP
jgi:uncharacterized membrane protein